MAVIQLDVKTAFLHAKIDEIVYVDDLLVAAKDSSDANQLLKYLLDKKIDVKELGAPREFLGVSVDTKDGVFRARCVSARSRRLRRCSSVVMKFAQPPSHYQVVCHPMMVSHATNQSTFWSALSCT